MNRTAIGLFLRVLSQTRPGTLQICACLPDFSICAFTARHPANLLSVSFQLCKSHSHTSRANLLSVSFLALKPQAKNAKFTATLLLRSYTEVLQTPRASLASSSACLPRTFVSASAMINLPDLYLRRMLFKQEQKPPRKSGH